MGTDAEALRTRDAQLCRAGWAWNTASTACCGSHGTHASLAGGLGAAGGGSLRGGGGQRISPFSSTSAPLSGKQRFDSTMVRYHGSMMQYQV